MDHAQNLHGMNRGTNLYKTLSWIGDANGQLHLLDQTRLPLHVENTICTTIDDVWSAIKALKVRGAPAIGVAAAYGVVIGLQASRGATVDQFLEWFPGVSRADVESVLNHEVSQLTKSDAA